MADAPIQNVVGIETRYSAKGQQTILSANEQISASIRHLIADQNALTTSTFRTVQAFRGQMMSVAALATSVDKSVSLGTRTAAQHLINLRNSTNMFYTAFSGNVKQNLAQLFRTSTAVKETTATLKREFNDIVMVNDKVIGSNRALQVSFDEMAAHGAIKARLLGSVWAGRLNRLADQMVTSGKQMQWVGRQMMVGITAPFVALSAVFSAAFLDLNKARIELHKFMIDATSDTDNFSTVLREELGPAIEEISIALAQSQSTVTEVAASWAATGKTMATGLVPLTKLTTQIAALTQGDVDLAGAMELVRSVQSSWNYEVGKTATEMKKLQLIQSITSLQMADIADALPIVSAAAQSFALSVSDTAALLSGMREKGVPSSQAAQALKFILARLAAPTTAAVEQWGRLQKVVKGVGDLQDIIFDKLGEGRGVKALQDIADAFFHGAKGGAELSHEMQVQVAAALVGNRQYDRFLKLLRAVNEENSNLNRALEATKDKDEALVYWKKQLAVVTESVSAEWQRFKVRLEVAAAKIGAIILPQLAKMAEAVVNIVEKMGELPKATLRFATSIGAFLSAMGPLIFALGMSRLAIGNIMKAPALALRGAFKVKAAESPGTLLDLAQRAGGSEGVLLRTLAGLDMSGISDELGEKITETTTAAADAGTLITGKLDSLFDTGPNGVIGILRAIQACVCGEAAAQMAEAPGVVPGPAVEKATQGPMLVPPAAVLDDVAEAATNVEKTSAAGTVASTATQEAAEELAEAAQKIERAVTAEEFGRIVPGTRGYIHPTAGGRILADIQGPVMVPGTAEPYEAISYTTPKGTAGTIAISEIQAIEGLKKEGGLSIGERIVPVPLATQKAVQEAVKEVVEEAVEEQVAASTEATAQAVKQAAATGTIAPPKGVAARITSAKTAGSTITKEVQDSLDELRSMTSLEEQLAALETEQFLGSEKAATRRAAWVESMAMTEKKVQELLKPVTVLPVSPLTHLGRPGEVQIPDVIKASQLRQLEEMSKIWEEYHPLKKTRLQGGKYIWRAAGAGPGVVGTQGVNSLIRDTVMAAKAENMGRTAMNVGAPLAMLRSTLGIQTEKAPRKSIFDVLEPGRYLSTQGVAQADFRPGIIPPPEARVFSDEALDLMAKIQADEADLNDIYRYWQLTGETDMRTERMGEGGKMIFERKPLITAEVLRKAQTRTRGMGPLVVGEGGALTASQVLGIPGVSAPGRGTSLREYFAKFEEERMREVAGRGFYTPTGEVIPIDVAQKAYAQFEKQLAEIENLSPAAQAHLLDLKKAWEESLKTQGIYPKTLEPRSVGEQWGGYAPGNVGKIPDDLLESERHLMPILGESAAQAIELPEDIQARMRELGLEPRPITVPGRKARAAPPGRSVLSSPMGVTRMAATRPVPGFNVRALGPQELASMMGVPYPYEMPTTRTNVVSGTDLLRALKQMETYEAPSGTVTDELGQIVAGPPHRFEGEMVPSEAGRFISNLTDDEAKLVKWVKELDKEGKPTGRMLPQFSDELVERKMIQAQQAWLNEVVGGTGPQFWESQQDFVPSEVGGTSLLAQIEDVTRTGPYTPKAVKRGWEVEKQRMQAVVRNTFAKVRKTISPTLPGLAPAIASDEELLAVRKTLKEKTGLDLPILNQAQLEKVVRDELEEVAKPPTPKKSLGPAARPATGLSGHKALSQITGPIPFEQKVQEIPEDIAAQMTAQEAERLRTASGAVTTKKLTAMGQKKLAQGVSLATILSDPKNYKVVEEAAKAAEELDDTIKGYGRGELVRNMGKLEAQRLALTTNTEFKAAAKELRTGDITDEVRRALYGEREGQAVTGTIYPSGAGETDEYRRRFEEASRRAAVDLGEEVADQVETAAAEAKPEIKPPAQADIDKMMENISEQLPDETEDLKLTDVFDDAAEKIEKPIVKAADDVAEEIGESVTHMSGVIADKAEDLSDWIGKEVRVPASGSLVGGKLTGFEESPILGTKSAVIEPGPGQIGGRYPVESVRKFYPTIAGGAPKPGEFGRDYLGEARLIEQLERKPGVVRDYLSEAKLTQQIAREQARARMAEAAAIAAPAAGITMTKPQYIGKTVQTEVENAVRAGMTASKGGFVKGIKQMAQMIPMLLTMGMYQPGMFGTKMTGPMPIVRPGTKEELQNILLHGTGEKGVGLGEQAPLVYEAIPTTGGQTQLFDTVGASKMGPALDNISASEDKVIKKTGLLHKITGAYTWSTKTLSEAFGPLNLKLLATNQSIGSTTMLLMRLTSALPEIMALITVGAAALLHWREVWEGLKAGASEAMSIIGTSLEQFVAAFTNELDKNAHAAKKGESVWVSFGKAIGAAMTTAAKAFRLFMQVAGKVVSSLVQAGEKIFQGFKGIGELFKEITGDGKGFMNALGNIAGGFLDVRDGLAEVFVILGGLYTLTKVVNMFKLLYTWGSKTVTGLTSGLTMLTTGVSQIGNMPTRAFWEIPNATAAMAAAYKKAGMEVQAVSGGLRVFANTSTVASAAAVRLTGAMTMIGSALSIGITIALAAITVWTIFKDKNDELAESVQRVTDASNTLTESWVKMMDSIKGKTPDEEIADKFARYMEELANSVKENFDEELYSPDRYETDAERAAAMYRGLAADMSMFQRLNLSQMEQAIQGAKEQLKVEEDLLHAAELKRDQQAAMIAAYDRGEPLLELNDYISIPAGEPNEGKRTLATLEEIVKFANIEMPKAATFAQKLQAIIASGLVDKDVILEAYGIPPEVWNSWGKLQVHANQSRIAVRALEAAIADLNNIQLTEFNTRVNGAVRDVRKQIVEQFRKAGKESKKAFNEAYAQAMESQFSQLTDAIVGSVMAQLDEAEQAQLDAVDKRIEAINEINEAEEKLQRDREYRRQRQELLDQQELTAAIALRERAKAILEGRFDDARILALQAEADKEQIEDDIKELDKEHKQDLVTDRREAKIERLEKQKERIQEIFDRERELLQNQLSEMTEFAARNEEEWRQMYANIADLAGKYGIRLPAINRQFFKSYGMTVEEGISDALHDARIEASREAEKLGDDLANSIQKGISKADAMKVWSHMANLVQKFNEQMTLVSAPPGVLHHLGLSMEDVTGGLSKEEYITNLFNKFKDAIFADIKKLKNWGFDITGFHTGGPVEGNGEVPAVLQSGEYVISRSAVNKIGLKTLDEINKYHKGGLVTDDAAYALAAGPAMMQYHAMKTMMPLLGHMLAGTLVSAAMPFYLQGMAYMMKNAAQKIAQTAGLEAIIQAGGLLPDISFTKGAPEATGTIMKGKGPFQVFPVAGTNYFYIDSWGAPRSGGRTHEGTDIMAAMGTPLLAVFPGTNIKDYNTLGGQVSKLFGAGGMAYYAHESKFGNAGRVEAGDVVGYVGATGNAGGPHLHFGWYPGGGAAVNPYPYLRAVDPKLQKYGNGGIVRTPTFARLGEFGPEMVVPLARFNTPGLNNIQFSGGGGMDTSAGSTSVEAPINIDVNFNGPFVGGPEAYRELYLTLEQAGRRIASERGTNVTSVRYGR